MFHIRARSHESEQVRREPLRQDVDKLIPLNILLLSGLSKLIHSIYRRQKKHILRLKHVTLNDRSFYAENSKNIITQVTLSDSFKLREKANAENNLYCLRYWDLVCGLIATPAC